MQCEIITIGDEILIGQTIDTNSAWLGRKLNELGFEIRQIHSVSDKPNEIIRALDQALTLVDLVVITGGLGPTNDDLTKKTLVDYFGGELVLDQEILDRLEAYFTHRGVQMLEAHRQQAYQPSKSRKLINNFGSASGMWFEKDEKVIISLPGVPYETKGIMRDFGFEAVQEYFNLPTIYHRTLLTWGRGESVIAKKIEDWEREVSEEGLKVAYLPSIGMVKIRISGVGSGDRIKKRIDKRAEELYSLLPNYIFGEDGDAIEEIVGKALKKNDLTVATAESCTGGHLAHKITSIPGSSDYFLGSIIAYSNSVKENLLKVRKIDIEKHSAVSESVVKQMAENVRELFGSDFGIATTGIAGPDGGNNENPVGTIWIAIASESGVNAKLLRLGTRRINNIITTSIICLGRLLQEIQK
jgi:nicotinamide-nucleotide amidase